MRHGVGQAHLPALIQHQHAVAHVFHHHVADRFLGARGDAALLGVLLLVQQARGQLVGQPGDDEIGRARQRRAKVGASGVGPCAQSAPPGKQQQRQRGSGSRAEGHHAAAEYARHQHREAVQRGVAHRVLRLQQLQTREGEQVDADGGAPVPAAVLQALRLSRQPAQRDGRGQIRARGGQQRDRDGLPQREAGQVQRQQNHRHQDAGGEKAAPQPRGVLVGRWQVLRAVQAGP